MAIEQSNNNLRIVDSAKTNEIIPLRSIILSPNEGEKWKANSKHYIIWTPQSKNEVVCIEFSVDNANTWKAIKSNVSCNGKFLWEVPDCLTSKCRIRISTAGSATFIESKIFSIIPSSMETKFTWTKITDSAPFSPRDGAGALVFKDKMWIIGGWNPNNKIFPRMCSNDVWSSNDGIFWKMEKPNTFLDSNFDNNLDWEGRHTAGYVVYQDKMWIVGGDANQGHYQNDVWNSENGIKWECVNHGNPLPWGPRILHYTLVFKNKIWIMGGQTLPQIAPAKPELYDDIWNSSDGKEWTKIKINSSHWSNRGMIGGSIVFRDRIWIVGGGTYQTPAFPERRFYNDVWSSTDGSEWTCHVKCAPWDARQYHDVAVFDNKMWILEGFNKSNRNDVWYSDDGENWYELPNTPWAPRHAASVFVYDNALWIIAGNNMRSDVWKLQKSK